MIHPETKIVLITMRDHVNESMKRCPPDLAVQLELMKQKMANDISPVNDPDGIKRVAMLLTTIDAVLN